MITVAETGPFQRKVAQLLSEIEKAELIAYLSLHPVAGVLIKGAGGIRKVRWARSGRGKSIDGRQKFLVTTGERAS